MKWFILHKHDLSCLNYLIILKHLHSHAFTSNHICTQTFYSLAFMLSLSYWLLITRLYANTIKNSWANVDENVKMYNKHLNSNCSTTSVDVSWSAQRLEWRYRLWKYMKKKMYYSMCQSVDYNWTSSNNVEFSCERW